MSRKKEKVLKHEKNADFKERLGRLLLIVFLLLNLYILNTEKAYASFSQESTDQSGDISEIEEKIFHEKYEKELLESRLTRLEEFIFKTTSKNESYEQRIKKIKDAFTSKENTNKLPEQIKNQTLDKTSIENTEKEEPIVIYDKSSNTGVIGAVNQIENKVFNMTFDNLPFQSRVSNLEDSILQTNEAEKLRKKSLMERVTYLLEKTGLQTHEQNNLKKDSQSPPRIRTYSIDPSTGFLINEANSEIVKDNYGNQIKVTIPRLQAPIFNPPSANQFNPYPSLPSYPNIKQPPGYPNQMPPSIDLLLNQYGYNQEPDY